MLLLLHREKAEVAAEVDQGGAFVVELELHASDGARILAAAVDKIFDGHFRERGGLVARQCRKIEVRIAVGGLAHVVGQVRGGDLAQLVDHPIGGQFGALGVLRQAFSIAAATLSFVRFSWPITRAVLAL